MSSKKLCLIGANSDLGSAIAKVSSKLSDIKVYGISRNSLGGGYEKILVVNDYETSEMEIKEFVKDNNISDIIILNGFIGKKNQPVEKIVKINFSIPINLIKCISSNGNDEITYMIISSLAASRPRKKNYVYGLSKYILEQSIRSRKSGKFIIFRSGFIRTKMTKDHKIPPFSRNPEDIAKKILNIILSNKKELSIKYSSFEIMLLFYLFKLIPLSLLNAIEKRML